MAGTPQRGEGGSKRWLEVRLGRGQRRQWGEDLEAVEFLGEGVQNRAGAPGGLDVGMGPWEVDGEQLGGGGGPGLVHSLVLGGRWPRQPL